MLIERYKDLRGWTGLYIAVYSGFGLVRKDPLSKQEGGPNTTGCLGAYRLKACDFRGFQRKNFPETRPFFAILGASNKEKGTPHYCTVFRKANPTACPVYWCNLLCSFVGVKNSLFLVHECTVQQQFLLLNHASSVSMKLNHICMCRTCCSEW